MWLFNIFEFDVQNVFIVTVKFYAQNQIGGKFVGKSYIEEFNLENRFQFVH